MFVAGLDFTVAAQNSSSYVWDFSDGSTLATGSSNAIHIYTVAGDYIPKIILTDTAGCNVPVIGTDTITVIDVRAEFVRNPGRLCDHGNVTFTSTSIANDLITDHQLCEPVNRVQPSIQLELWRWYAFNTECTHTPVQCCWRLPGWPFSHRSIWLQGFAGKKQLYRYLVA